MIFPFASFLTLVAAVSAVPFKRYDNGSYVSSGPYDTTVTIDKYITITLDSSTLVLPASATSEVAAAQEKAVQPTVTSVITQYVTTTIDGSAVTSAVSTYTTTVSETHTTSTITSFVTVTKDDASLVQASEVCEPTTVTVTVAAASASVTPVYEVLTTSVPVVGEISYSDITTTITTFVEVVTTQTSFSTLSCETETSSPSSVPVNGTYPSLRRLRRGLSINF